jgi:hypothetical protein
LFQVRKTESFRPNHLTIHRHSNGQARGPAHLQRRAIDLRQTPFIYSQGRLSCHLYLPRELFRGNCGTQFRLLRYGLSAIAGK